MRIVSFLLSSYKDLLVLFSLKKNLRTIDPLYPMYFELKAWKEENGRGAGREL